MTEMGLKFLLFVGKKMLRKLEKKKHIFQAKESYILVKTYLLLELRFYYFLKKARSHIWQVRFRKARLKRSLILFILPPDTVNFQRLISWEECIFRAYSFVIFYSSSMLYQFQQFFFKNFKFYFLDRDRKIVRNN